MSPRPPTQPRRLLHGGTVQRHTERTCPHPGAAAQRPNSPRSGRRGGLDGADTQAVGRNLRACSFADQAYGRPPWRGQANGRVARQRTQTGKLRRTAAELQQWPRLEAAPLAGALRVPEPRAGGAPASPQVAPPRRPAPPPDPCRQLRPSPPALIGKSEAALEPGHFATRPDAVHPPRLLIPLSFPPKSAGQLRAARLLSQAALPCWD